MPNLEVVYSTKGLNTLLSSLNKISKQFAALDKQAASFKSVNKSANVLTATVKPLTTAATALNSAANNLRQAANVLRAATGGKPINSTGGRRTGNGSFSQLLKSFIFSTRFNVGGGSGLSFSPLIGRLAPLIAKLGPVGEAATAFVGAGVALFELTKSAAQLGQEFYRLSVQLGSSGKTTAFLSSAGAAVGLSPSAIGSLASSLQNRITGDQMARAIGMSMGVYNIAGPYGNQDYGSQLQKIILGLRAESNPMRRLIEARGLFGDEQAASALQLASLSNKQFSYIGKDSAVKNAIFTPEFEENSNNFIAAMSRVAESFKTVLAAIGTPLLTQITKAANSTADAFYKLAVALISHQNQIKGLFDIISGSIRQAVGVATFNPWMIGGGLSQFNQGISELNKPNSPEQLRAINDALHANSTATEENTAATLRLVGRFGRGERADRAVPSGMNAMFLRQALIYSGIRLSQF